MNISSNDRPLRSEGSARVLQFIAAALIFIFLFSQYLRWFQTDADRFGKNDFVQYWSAKQLMTAGLDPYNPEQLLHVERTVGWQGDEPLMMWNPPWLLTLMSPVLHFDFETSSKLWVVVNICLVLGVVALVGASVRGSVARVIRRSECTFMIIAAAAFFPLWEVIGVGQVSLIIAFGSALLLYGLTHERAGITAAALVLLTIKPHLTYLLFIVLALWIVRTRRYSIVAYAAAIMVGLVGLTYAYAPTALDHWWSILGRQRDEPLVIGMEEWTVATAVGGIRMLIARWTGSWPVWPMSIIPAVASLAVILSYTLSKQSLRFIRWDRDLPLLLLLSVSFSPYGWTFDHAVLLIPYLLMMKGSLCLGRRYYLLSIVLLLLQVITSVLAVRVFDQQHHFFWFPLVILANWIFFDRKSDSSSGRSDEDLVGALG